MGVGVLDSEDGVLNSEYGGVRHIWIHEGKGEIYLTAGYRTKEGDSFESIQPGDQLTVTGDEEVKGRFRYWWIENLDGVLTHISTTCNRKILNSNKNGGKSKN